jgi:hypothetical protein
MATLPELKRVPKSSVFGGGSTSVDVEVEQQQQQQNQQQEQQILTRNMLMNIILRPGGGDKTRALPRPQVRNILIVNLSNVIQQLRFISVNISFKYCTNIFSSWLIILCLHL